MYFNNSIGLRCPAHGLGREVLKAGGVGVVASSANLKGAGAPLRLMVR